MAGAVLIVPPVVEIGDVSVVEKEGLFDSSLSRCSWVKGEVKFKQTATRDAVNMFDQWVILWNKNKPSELWVEPVPLREQPASPAHPL